MAGKWLKHPQDHCSYKVPGSTVWPSKVDVRTASLDYFCGWTLSSLARNLHDYANKSEVRPGRKSLSSFDARNSNFRRLFARVARLWAMISLVVSLLPSQNFHGNRTLVAEVSTLSDKRNAVVNSVPYPTEIVRFAWKRATTRSQSWRKLIRVLVLRAISPRTY